MSASTRDQRFTVYAYSNVGTDGIVQTSYVRTNSTAADKGWWGRVEEVNARESLIAEQQAHKVDVLIEFGDEVTGISTDGAVRHLASSTLYKITGVKKARAARAIMVHAERVDDEIYNNVVETP